jgi:hypothetical protein
MRTGRGTECCAFNNESAYITLLPTLSTVISLCNTIYERGLEGKHPMNSVSNANQELTLFEYEMNSVSNINYL